MESALSSAYGSRQISQIFAPNDEYQVIMQVAPQYQQDPAALSMLYVQAPGGKLVPLSAVVTTRQSVGPQSINHIGQLPSVTLSFNLAPGVALGDAVARVEQLARETLPSTVSGSFQGTAQAFQESLRGLGWVLALAIFVIYVVLGILYESFIHPLTILSGLPSAGFGALLTLLHFQAGPEHLRLRRRHHAGRPRQEERHHDDRLRDRGAARTATSARRTRSTRPAWCGSGRS